MNYHNAPCPSGSIGIREVNVPRGTEYACTCTHTYTNTEEATGWLCLLIQLACLRVGQISQQYAASCKTRDDGRGRGRLLWKGHATCCSRKCKGNNLEYSRKLHYMFLSMVCFSSTTAYYRLVNVKPATYHLGKQKSPQAISNVMKPTWQMKNSHSLCLSSMNIELPEG